MTKLKILAREIVDAALLRLATVELFERTGGDDESSKALMIADYRLRQASQKYRSAWLCEYKGKRKVRSL